MAQSSQFSAAKVLEAAQQAEAGGNREYAVQFYRHIAEQHPHSTEAVSAHKGLSRLLGSQQAVGAQRSDRTQPPAGTAHTSLPPVIPVATGSSTVPGTSPTQTANGAASQSAAAVHRPGEANGEAMNGTSPHDARTNGVDHANGTRAEGALHFASPAQHNTVANSTANQKEALSYQPSPSTPRTERDHQHAASPLLHLPVTKDRYRIGRMIAIVFGAIGWLLLMGGILAIIAVLAGPGIIPGILPRVGGLNALIPVVTIGVVAFFTGLVMVFSGQLARAIFDNANSARELVAIQRVKSRH